MRHRRIVLFWALGAAFVLSTAAHAVSTLRVGNQVLTAGDSAARVTELLGRPSYKSRSRRSGSGSRSGYSRGSRRSRGTRVRSEDHDYDYDGGVGGEKWQYRRDDHVTTVTIVDGKVVDIDDRHV